MLIGEHALSGVVRRKGIGGGAAACVWLPVFVHTDSLAELFNNGRKGLLHRTGLVAPKVPGDAAAAFNRHVRGDAGGASPFPVAVEQKRSCELR